MLRQSLQATKPTSRGPGRNLVVIGAGFGRTGTASLKVALEQLTGGVCYHMVGGIMSRRNLINRVNLYRITNSFSCLCHVQHKLWHVYNQIQHGTIPWRVKLGCQTVACHDAGFILPLFDLLSDLAWVKLAPWHGQPLTAVVRHVLFWHALLIRMMCSFMHALCWSSCHMCRVWSITFIFANV